MGQTGSVGYMFNKKGYILLERSSAINEDELMLELLDIGAEDFVSDEEYIEIITLPDSFSKVREYIEEKKYTIVEADIKMLPSIKKDLSDEEEEKFQTFLDKLESNEDVQDVWHNADI
jgi:transcriptional/translational regulatory protein YebC/TACO1